MHPNLRSSNLVRLLAGQVASNHSITEKLLRRTLNRLNDASTPASYYEVSDLKSVEGGWQTAAMRIPTLQTMDAQYFWEK